MFCPNCGTQLPDHARFCAGCGSAIPEVVPQQPIAPEVTTEATKKKPKVSKKLLLILAIVLAAAAAFLIFSKKTVYLQTSVETINYSGNDSIHTIYEYEYDDNGIILSYGYESFRSGDRDEVSSYDIDYEYDDDGRLESAKVKGNSYTIDYEYSYTKDGTLKKIEGTYRDSNRRSVATCNENGQVESVKTYNSSGEVSHVISYKYHKDGSLAEKTTKNGSYLYKYRYESNRMVEQVVRRDGTLVQRIVYAYDDKGLLTEQSTYGEDNKLMASIFIDYTFKGKKLTGITFTFIDEEGEEYVISGEAAWEGRNATIELDFSEIDDEDVPEEASIELEYDKHGNMTDMVLYADGEPVQEQHIEYQKVRVPRNYEALWSIDPIWLQN